MRNLESPASPTTATSKSNNNNTKMESITIKVGDEEIILSNNEEYKDFLADEGVKFLRDGSNKRVGGFHSLVGGRTYTLGPPAPKHDEIVKVDADDVKQLANFARASLESKTEKKEMSKASTQFAQELVGAMGLVVKTLDPNIECTTVDDPGHYPWTVKTVDGDTGKKGEHQGTPGARDWFERNFLSGSDLESKGYRLNVSTGSLLPVLKAGGKQATGKGGMVIGRQSHIEIADSVYEQAPGLIELKTDEYPIKVGQVILELTAFSMVSRFERGVALLASDCNTKWRLLWFNDHKTIHRRNYKSARKCWADFVALLKSAEDKAHSLVPPRKKRLATDEQDLGGFGIEADKKQKAVDNEAMLHNFANYLGELYGERPIVPDWARAERICPDYYI